MRRALALASTIACGPVVATEAADTDATTTDTPMPMPTTITSTSADPGSMTAASSAPTGGDPSSTGPVPSSTTSDAGNDFIENPDGGNLGGNVCDVWVDDCPPGQKCMPWANDGGGSWNSTKCSPLAEDPNHIGDPCTVEGSGVSGVDDCEARSMCWDVNPRTNVGTCVAFCSGSEANPTCAGDACTACTVANDGVLILCLMICDPLQQDCAEGQGCFALGDAFTCAYEAGAEGAVGDPCELSNVCSVGLFCGDAERLPDCPGEDGCCTRFCEVGLDTFCGDILPGTECIPWFDEGEEPPCFAHVVGGCLLPE